MPNRSHPGPDQQELLLQFVRQLPVAVAMFDRGLRCLHASNRWGAIFGVGPAEMVGRAPQEVVPDFPDTWLSWMHRGLAGETLSAEEEQIEWQGRLMWIRWSISPWGTLDGLPAGVLVFVEDVTVGKAAQAALAQSEQEFRDLVESSPDGIARLDLDGRYLFANQRMADWGQVKTTDFPGRLLGSFAIPGIEFWQPIVQRVIQSKRPETVRYSSPAESGGRGVRVRLIPELLSDGAVDSVLVIATDISDLEQAESLATERESLIATMFEAAAQGIVGVDASGLIQVANGMAEGMFGYSSGELLNQPLDILIPDDCRRAHALHFAGFIQEAGKRPMDRNLPLSGRRKDGSVFPVDVSLSSARSRGVFLGVAFITDTSERERQNSALRSQQEELQKLKAALYAAEEAAARDLARELHDDITQRLAFLSIEIGKAAVEQDPAASILPRLRSFQSRIQQISEDVREISHRMHPSILEDLGLTVALESLTQDLELASGVPARFEAIGVPEKVPAPIASCLYRVCQECVRNIVNHADARDIRIRLSGQGDWLELEVTDSGKGFDPKTVKRGLGTFSMMERVSLVGGTISVYSQPNQGTRVTVRVPLGPDLQQ